MAALITITRRGRAKENGTWQRRAQTSCEVRMPERSAARRRMNSGGTEICHPWVTRWRAARLHRQSMRLPVRNPHDPNCRRGMAEGSGVPNPDRWWPMRGHGPSPLLSLHALPVRAENVSGDH
jgi:hypothetical protein